MKSMTSRSPLVSELHRVITAGGGVLRVVGIRDVNLDNLGIIKKVLHVRDLKTHYIPT